MRKGQVYTINKDTRIFLRHCECSEKIEEHDVCGITVLKKNTSFLVLNKKHGYIHAYYLDNKISFYLSKEDLENMEKM